MKHIHEKRQPVSCNFCGDTFSKRQNLLRHVAVIHQQLRPWRCDVCSASFPYNNELVRHREKAHNIVRGPKIELDGPCDLVSALRLIFTSATRRRQNASDGSVGIVSKKH